MPRGDGTGPMGMGSMTGRAAGYCAGVPTQGQATAPARGFGFGRGFGRGRGFGGGGGGGRGWRHWYYATGLPGWMRAGGVPTAPVPPTPEVQKQALQTQAQALEAQLQAIKNRLDEMDAGHADND